MSFEFYSKPIFAYVDVGNLLEICKDFFWKSKDFFCILHSSVVVYVGVLVFCVCGVCVCSFAKPLHDNFVQRCRLPYLMTMKLVGVG